MAIFIFLLVLWYGGLFFQTFFLHRYAAHQSFTMSKTAEKMLKDFDAKIKKANTQVANLKKELGVLKSVKRAEIPTEETNVTDQASKKE